MPALIIIEELNRLGAKVKAYDPIVSQSGLSHGLSGVIIETNAEMLSDNCDALVLITDWQEFLNLNYQKMAEVMINPVDMVLLHHRSVLQPDEMPQDHLHQLRIVSVPTAVSSR